jgi:hypothetical protein
MTARRRRIYLACFVVHFTLVILAAARDLASLLREGGNVFPASFEGFWQGSEIFLSTALGERLGDSNPLRQAVTFYTQGAGIESGYGFFAPNVPNSYKLVFELHYPDGRVQYELPHVAGNAAGLRVVSLFDNIGHIRYELLRRTTLKMLAYSVWREHPHATTIRAVFGTVQPPRIDAFLRGEKESYEFLYAYDFSFAPAATDHPK